MMDNLVPTTKENTESDMDNNTSSTERSHNHFDGLVQERRNSIALAMELRLSCTNPSILTHWPLEDSTVILI